MEIMIVIIVALIIILLVYLQKYYLLKKDLDIFIDKLQLDLNKLLNQQNVQSCNEDLLYGKIATKLNQISQLYLQKNQEISLEKEKTEELISNIAHQIKTPMANIRLYLELLHQESDDANKKEMMEKVLEQSEKLDFLLESLIKMSRLETGTITILKQPCLISDTLSKAIETIMTKAISKNIDIYVDCDENLIVNHDQKWTGEAIFNLLDNAIKYSKTNTKVKIKVEQQEIFTKISIHDQGKGIALARQGLIFSRFYREPEVHDQKGIGIGLFLSREIISKQGGYIEVESEVEKGSTFIIYLLN